MPLSRRAMATRLLGADDMVELAGRVVLALGLAGVGGLRTLK